MTERDPLGRDGPPRQERPPEGDRPPEPDTQARRKPVLCALGGALAATALLSAVVGMPGPGPGVPPAPDADALLVGAAGSTWSCAGATGAQGAVPGTVVLANAGSAPARADVDVVSDQGWSHRQSVTVPAGTELEVPESAPGNGSWAGAVVNIFGGTVAVSQRVSTPWGNSVQPCAPNASPVWYFPSGSVTAESSEEITLVNPYSTVADVKLSFTTEQGVEAPAAFSSISVPAQGIASVDVGSHLRRRDFVATAVQALSGEVVAFRTEIVRGNDAGAGVTLQLGSRAGHLSNWFAEGGQGPGRTETFWIYNPGARGAQVHLTLSSDGGSQMAAKSSVASGATTMHLAPYGVAALTTNNESWVLPGSRYSVNIRSNVPVVAERDVTCVPLSGVTGRAALVGSASGADAWVLAPLAGWSTRAPAAGRGWPFGALSSAGLSIWESTWAWLGDGRTARHAGAFVDVLNPGPSGARVTMAGETSMLGPDQEEQLPLPTAYWARPVLVQASVPVVVSLEAYSDTQQPGIDLSPAIPLEALR